MKRKLFLLNSFLSILLLCAVSFHVISCRKSAASVNESNETTDIAISKKAILIKQKTKQIIDDYTTNSNNEDNKEWIIDLYKIEDREEKIRLLKQAVSNMKNHSNNQPISQVDSVLEQIIREKIMQISQYVTNKLKLDNTLDLPSDFQIEINNDFEPKLANFTTSDYMKALEKLLNSSLTIDSLKQTNFGSKTYQYALMNNKFASDTDKTEPSNQPDIFKINTNFSYTFNYAGIKETDEYKDLELLLSANVTNTHILKENSHQQIQKVLNELIEPQFLIYDGNVTKNSISSKNYENLTNKFNWDFKDEKVRNEIKDIQVQKLTNIIAKNSVLKAFKFDQEEVEYELIDAMNFSNENISKPLTRGDNTVNLVYGYYDHNSMTSFSSIRKNLLKQLGISEREKGVSGLEYYFNQNDENHYWDGGELNKEYVRSLEENNKIKEFYNDGQYLVGYGNFYMSRITFADLKLSPLEVKIDLMIDEVGFSGMLSSLMKYLEGLINVLQNNDKPEKPGYKIEHNITGEKYAMQWKFYDEEWIAILEEVKIKKQISLNWIMENIIYKLRAAKSKHKSAEYIKELSKYWDSDAIPKAAIESFKTTNEILYGNMGNENTPFLFWDESSSDTDYWHFKFGPFKIFLSDKHSFYSSNFYKHVTRG